MQLKNFTKKDQKDSRNYFVQCAILSGAIMTGCAGAQAQNTPAQKPIDLPVATPTPQACNFTDNSILAGKQISFGVSSLDVYTVNITDVNCNHLTADIRMPMGYPLPAVNLLSVQLTFDSVEMNATQVISVLQTMNEQVQASRKSILGMESIVEGSVEKLDEFNRSLGVKGSNTRATPPSKKTPTGDKGSSYPEFFDSSSSLAQLIGNESGIRHTLAILKSMRSGITTSPDEQADFSVESSDPDKFVLRTQDGERFRLRRKIDLNVEFMFEKSGYITVPYNIESLSADASGKVNATVSIDCSRDLVMEIHMSEYARGKNPVCYKH